MTNSLHQIPLDAEILNRTPLEVIELFLSLLKRIRVLEARVEGLEAKLKVTMEVFWIPGINRLVSDGR